jgi:cellulose synthase/poly-beta-1,6-N-acetylglucosamine synthase-like glycosyltransferase
MTLIITSLLVISGTIYGLSILYLGFGFFRLQGPRNSKLRTFTVIIAVHNEEQHLRQCLDSVLAQDYPADRYDVILADDRSTDATPMIIAEYCRVDRRIQCVRVDTAAQAIPKKTALLRALDRAQGEFIASTDGDCVVPTTWLSSLNGYCSDDAGMVIGHTAYLKTPGIGPGIDALDYLSQRALGAAFVGVGSAYTCTASNMAYRREIFTNNRAAFAALKIRPAEDNFFLHCVHTASRYRLVVATDPASYIITSGAQSVSHFLQQRVRWAAYGGNITTRGVKLFFLPAVFFFLMVLITSMYAVFTPKILPVLGALCALKALVDAFFILKAAILFHQRSLLKYFPLVWLVQLVMVPYSILKGNLSSFVWKGQRYTPEKRIEPSVE